MTGRELMPQDLELALLFSPVVGLLLTVLLAVLMRPSIEALASFATVMWWAISTAMVASFILIAHLIVWLLEAWWSRLVYLLEAQS